MNIHHGRKLVVEVHKLTGHFQIPIRYSSYNFSDILSDDNKKRCQKSLHFSEELKVMRWMKAKSDIKKAAVLVPLCTVHGVPSILYTVRSNKLVKHAGQVSFPGGNHDEEDVHMMRTALRESEEEVGLLPENVDLWGQMAPFPGKGFETAVTPLVAYCGEINVDDLQVSKDEVASVFTVPIATLCDSKFNGYTLFKKGGYQLPVYTGGPHRIWGLTAAITHLLLRLLINDTSIYSLQLENSKRLQDAAEKANKMKS